MCNTTRLPCKCLTQPEDKEDVVACRRRRSGKVADCQKPLSTCEVDSLLSRLPLSANILRLPS